LINQFTPPTTKRLRNFFLASFKITHTQKTRGVRVGKGDWQGNFRGPLSQRVKVGMINNMLPRKRRKKKQGKTVE
jgi:hypothetical protein